MAQVVIRKTHKHKGKNPFGSDVYYCSGKPGWEDNQEKGYLSRNWNAGAFWAALDKSTIIFEDNEETRDILGYLRCMAGNSENEYWEKAIYDIVPVDYEFRLNIEHEA